MTECLVLVADEAPLARKLLRVLLEPSGYAVRSAGSVAEALLLVDSLKPALVLADFRLAAAGSGELVRRIRGRKDLDQVVVLVMASQSDRAEALLLAPDGVLEKPLDTLAVPELLRSHLARRRTPGQPGPEKP